MNEWDKMKELEKHYRVLVKPVSEALAGYLCVMDMSEDDVPDYKIHLGNLPMPCPNCGRSRLNFHPDFHRIDCEKCDWFTGGPYDQ